jgi:kynureninase
VSDATRLGRVDAERLDAADPLAPFRDRFRIDDPDVLYLDGNSLGRLPLATARRLQEAVEREWGSELAGAWDHWIDLPTRVGDAIGRVVGAAAGQVAVSDSTTINLYKLAVAALRHRRADGRRVVVADREEFPTDRYVLTGLGDDVDVRWAPPADLGAAVAPGDVALVVYSLVDYRTAELRDLHAITRQAHDGGALVLWDLSHAAGSVPVDLDGAGADLAVGCTYKYLNGGPGSPAFLYVRRDLQPVLDQPIHGWFGQREQFAMGPAYDPQPDIRRFLTGTANVLALHAIQEGVDLTIEAGIGAIRAKSVAQTDLVAALADAWLADSGFRVGSPRDSARRGSHVALRHPDGAAIAERLWREARVVVDFRLPDVIRLGIAPLYTRYVDVWDALARLRDVAG